MSSMIETYTGLLFSDKLLLRWNSYSVCSLNLQHTVQQLSVFTICAAVTTVDDRTVDPPRKKPESLSFSSFYPPCPTSQKQNIKKKTLSIFSFIDFPVRGTSH